MITTVGITRAKEGLIYQQVDCQANQNLLNEAKRSGVRKFIYISVFNGERLKNIAICKAKEEFVQALKHSGLEYCVIRPTGYYSDMAEFFNLAEKGRVYLFGNGTRKMNPIHGADLASICVKTIDGTQTEINIGGPDTMTYTEIAEMAFEVLNKPPKIPYIPDWIRKLALRLGRIFMRKSNFGPFEFLLTVMAMDMNATEYGNHSLRRYFSELKKSHT